MKGRSLRCNAQRVYDRYGHYVIPRIRGTFALHQLRLMMGNAAFLKLMNDRARPVQEQADDDRAVPGSPCTSAGGAVAPASSCVSGSPATTFPHRGMTARCAPAGDAWTVTVTVKQAGTPYRFASSVAIESERETEWRPIVVSGAGRAVHVHRQEETAPRRRSIRGMTSPSAVRTMPSTRTSLMTSAACRSCTGRHGRSRRTTRSGCATRP